MGAEMNYREALADLLEAVEAAIEAGDWKVDGACDPESVIRRAKEALTQPEQIVPSNHPNSHQPKPVAFRNKQTGEFCTGGFLRWQLGQWTPLYDHPYELVCVCGAAWEGDTMVETPRKRTWVGLTDEEIAAWNIFGNESLRVVRAIEAKLKEKNT